MTAAVGYWKGQAHGCLWGSMDIRESGCKETAVGPEMFALISRSDQEYLFPIAAVINHHTLSGFNNTNLVSSSYRGQASQ